MVQMLLKIVWNLVMIKIEIYFDQILNKNQNKFYEMVKHKYANYVIQKLLTYCNSKQQQRLIYHIERNIPNLRTMNYGKHIMDKIKKIKQQHGFNTNDNNNNNNNQTIATIIKDIIKIIK